jgi:glycosyltransferase involved in cell wall biosynthesis
MRFLDRRPVKVENDMKILRLQSYCYPEVLAASHMLHDLNCAYQKAAITTEVYTPTPTRGIDSTTRKKYARIKYEELYGGFYQVHRFSMFREGRNPIQRAFRYFLCNVIQYWKGIHAKDIDLVYSSSTPPTQGILSGLVKKHLCRKYKRYVPFIYNLQDVFPDSLVTTGLAKEGALIWKLGRKIEKATYRYADRIIVISQSMKRNIMAKGVPEEKIEVISNWIDTDSVKPVEKEKNCLFEEFGIDREKFTVVYAGNFGAAQGASVVLEAAALLPDIQFVIFGGGAEFEAAKAKAATLPNVIINGLLPQDRVPEIYSLGDVALITCKKGVGTSGMPSKTWSIMACNTPIIAAFDTNSELSEIIQTANAGMCVDPENAVLLAQAIIAMKGAIGQYDGGRAYVCKNASKTVCVAKYVEILKQR